MEIQKNAFVFQILQIISMEFQNIQNPTKDKNINKFEMKKFL
jgi:hypothetical protein